jgi:hypothetical protein
VCCFSTTGCTYWYIYRFFSPLFLLSFILFNVVLILFTPSLRRARERERRTAEMPERNNNNPASQVYSNENLYTLAKFGFTLFLKRSLASLASFNGLVRVCVCEWILKKNYKIQHVFIHENINPHRKTILTKKS